MADAKRVRVVWTGAGVVGGGLSTFYVSSTSTGFLADIRTFYNAIGARLPNQVTISFPNSGDTIDETTGELSGTWSEPAATAVTGGNTGNFVMATGARVRWRTAGIVAGRRVVGTTFLVPLSDDSFDRSNALESTAQATLQTAADNLWTALTGELLIYSRPAPGRGGTGHFVTGANVPDAVSWLRSRRT